MGGRGTFASGNVVGFKWETVATFNGVKVLEYKKEASGLNLSRKLPEESHSSNAYLLLDKNGNFSQYREYNNNHELVFEIGYHYEGNIAKHQAKTLHVHEYSNDFKNRTTRPISIAEYEKYKKLFKGVENDW